MNPIEDRNHVEYQRGDKAFASRRYSEAKAHFKAAIALWPEDYLAHLALGNCYCELGKHQKAENSFREALLFAPENKRAIVQFNFANALFDQGRFAEAQAAYIVIEKGCAIYAKVQRNLMLARKALELSR